MRLHTLPGMPFVNDMPAGTEAATRMLIAQDPALVPCLEVDRPMTWEVRPNGFPGLVHIILEQQVSTAAGTAMWKKLCNMAGSVTPETFLLLDDDVLRHCGFSRQKMQYCRSLAAEVRDRRFDPDALASMTDDEAMAALTARKGIGRWTAEIYLLMVLGRPDLWPAGDLALQIGLQRLLGLPKRPMPAETDARAEAWRPHRSLAARLIWNYYLAGSPPPRPRRTQP